MPNVRESVVARARALVGVRFRPQGRSRESGLDCIGLAAAALGIEGARRDYRLRGGSPAELERGLRAAGLRPVARAAPGDLIVLRAGPEQLHLGIWAGESLVHADAGLGRVVDRPGVPPWPTIATWRLEK